MKTNSNEINKDAAAAAGDTAAAASAAAIDFSTTDVVQHQWQQKKLRQHLCLNKKLFICLPLTFFITMQIENIIEQLGIRYKDDIIYTITIHSGNMKYIRKE